MKIYIPFIAIFFILISCSKTSDKKTDNYVISIKDHYGRDVKIKDYPKKIISVSPAITELFFEFESGYKLIGRTDYCLYPIDSVKKITSIGGINNANLEKIISLKPDLVIVSSIFTKKMLEVIENAGIPVVSLPGQTSIDDVYKTYKIVGRILNEDKKADSIINVFKTKLNDVKKLSNNKIKPKVYYVVQYGSGGDYSAGEKTFINEIITLAGGDNIAKETKNWSFSKEALFANEPDFIFLRKQDSASFIKTHPYNNLKAVKEGNVYGIESSWIDIQSTRNILAIEFMSNTINR